MTNMSDSNHVAMIRAVGGLDSNWKSAVKRTFGGAMPWISIGTNRKLTARSLELSNCIRQIAQAMRDGHSFSTALEAAGAEPGGQDTNTDLAAEFRVAMREWRMGLPPDVVMQRFAQRVHLLDAFVVGEAIRAGHHTGQSMVQVMDKLTNAVMNRANPPTDNMEMQRWNTWRNTRPELILDLVGADLANAKLQYCDLRRADLRRANLIGADLTGADLCMSRLTDASLEGATLNGSVIGWTVLDRVALSTCLGRMEHLGPLCDALHPGQVEGLPKYIDSVAAERPVHCSCFISYSTADQEFAELLHSDLEANGIRCWFAPHHVRGGKKLLEQIDEAIGTSQRLLLILSTDSMSSNWVRTEVANARQREVVEGRQMLFPIRIVPFEVVRQWKAFDPDTGTDSAREIREYHIPDFTNWRDREKYAISLTRLLMDLTVGSDGQGDNGGGSGNAQIGGSD
jgi:TIR domain/Pentapeptide repeats (8 copies)